MRPGFEYTLGHGYATAILACDSICVQDLSMRPVKRFLDMHPSMSRLRRLYYCMSSSMH